MNTNPHFRSVDSWQAAAAELAFEPLELDDAPGRRLQTLSIHIRDHKLRELPSDERTLEAHYGDFVFTQRRMDKDEAARQVLSVPFGAAGRALDIGNCTGRVYELGPEPPADDPDGRSPSVVVWHDKEMFYLLASGTHPVDTLIGLAGSLCA